MKTTALNVMALALMTLVLIAGRVLEPGKIWMSSVDTGFPGGAPDKETHDLMHALSELQTWCALMAQKDSGGGPAAQLIQETRAYIVSRTYPRAIAAQRAGNE